MKKIKIKKLEEDVYYEKMANGLEVFLYTKDDVYTNYVTFTTKYGSVYNDFIPIGEDKIKSFPKGIAHFLEHKVFTEKEDPQPMEFFAKSGSICNAFTTFRNTTYLFYATKDLKENINYLLNYVQNIYLTDESVEKEKGIISEEIHMYEDRPTEVLFEKVRLNTLNSNPYRNSIIGTVKDIESITKDDLETCYHTFYHPSNMFMVVTGSFDPEEIMNLIRENQNNKEFKDMNKIVVKDFKEDNKVVKEKEIITMNTNIPKVAYTIKIPLKNIKLTRRQLHLYMYILFTTLFDETSTFDEELKKEGIINNTTYVSLLNTDTHLLITLINETDKYNEFLDKLKDKLDDIEISEKDFNRKKKVLISNEIFAYENVENINDIIMDSIIYNNELEDDPIGLISNLSIKELLDLIYSDNSTIVRIGADGTELRVDAAQHIAVYDAVMPIHEELRNIIAAHVQQANKEGKFDEPTFPEVLEKEEYFYRGLVNMLLIDDLDHLFAEYNKARQEAKGAITPQSNFIQNDIGRIVGFMNLSRQRCALRSADYYELIDPEFALIEMTSGRRDLPAGKNFGDVFTDVKKLAHDKTMKWEQAWKPVYEKFINHFADEARKLQENDNSHAA